MAAKVTTYLYINNPSYKLVGADGYTTTSTTLSSKYFSMKYEDIIYNDTYPGTTMDYDTTGRYDAFTYTHTELKKDSNAYSYEARNDTCTVVVSCPSNEYTSVYTTNSSQNFTTVSTRISPSAEYVSVDKLNLRLRSGGSYSESMYNATDVYHSLCLVDSNNSSYEAFKALTRISSSLTATLSLQVSRTYSCSYWDSFTRESSDKFVSKTYMNNTWYGTLTNTSDTVGMFQHSITYGTQEDGLYTTIQDTFNPGPAARVGILDRNVTNQTSWLNNPNAYYTSTASTYGIVADREGNVYYGRIFGRGGALRPGSDNLIIPAIITNFYDAVEVGTADTSWFNTFSTRTSSANSASTYETYVEYNNHGLDYYREGGSFTKSTYTWVLSTYTKKTYSTHTDTAGVNVNDNGYYLTYTTLPVDAVVSYQEYGTLSDNKCSFSSSVKSSIGGTRYSYSGRKSSSYSFDSISSSYEINKTRVATSSIYTVSIYASAYNSDVSVTNTASDTLSASRTTSSSVSYSNVSSDSCEVTGYTDRNGYSYYTSFTGELAGVDRYGRQTLYTSWVNSAINRSSKEKFSDDVSQSTVEIIRKTFGDPINSTTVSQESILSSTVYKSMYKTSVSIMTYVDSYTVSSINIPEEYFTTYHTTYKDSTLSWTYQGPDEDEYGDYEFDVSVTSIGTNSGLEYVGQSFTTYSRLNTVDYGGTTYRLSDFISSKSWINVGNVSFTENYLYDYSVRSMYSFDGNYIKSLSTYTTRLATAYTRSLNTIMDYDTYSATKSTSLVGISTGDRFIDRVETSRTYTLNYSVSNTVVYYNGSTLDTISSSTRLYNTESEQDVATVSRTFISSTADFSSSESVISTGTDTKERQQFIRSISTVMASTIEQQNDTLIFQSTVATISDYNASTTYFTVSTMQVDYEATTYTDEYNPAIYTASSVKSQTELKATTKMSSVTNTARVTQSIGYTPVYSDVNGIYVTQ